VTSRLAIAAAVLASLALSACAGPAWRTRDERPAPTSFPPAVVAPPEQALGVQDAGEPPAGESDLEVLAADTLARFVRGRTAELRACYDEALARAPVLRGKVVMRFTVRPDGSVSDVAPWYDNLGGGVAQPCLVDRVAAWQTPFRPAEPVQVDYPLAFAPPPRGQPAAPAQVADQAASGRLETAAGRPLE
jgi:hypothetical protein